MEFLWWIYYYCQGCGKHGGFGDKPNEGAQHFDTPRLVIHDFLI